jgi:hypothetical protein
MFGGVAGWCSVAGRIAFSGFIHASRCAAKPVSNYAAAAKSKNIIVGNAKWSVKLTQRR